jgi:hypothetical protein
MKDIKHSEKFASGAAVVTALATLSCCLPWGIGAALGTMGMGMVFEKHRTLFIAVSVVLLCIGGFQLYRTSKSCQKFRPCPLIVMALCGTVVLVIALFPNWLARLMVNL